jgi:hypothetical protein
VAIGVFTQTAILFAPPMVKIDSKKVWAQRSRSADWLQVFRSPYDGRWYWNRRSTSWKVVRTAESGHGVREAAERDARRLNPGVQIRSAVKRRRSDAAGTPANH